MPDFYCQARRIMPKTYSLYLRRPGGHDHTCVMVDPWLCVAGFHRVCLYRTFVPAYTNTLCLQTLQKTLSRSAVHYWTGVAVLRAVLLSLSRVPPTNSYCVES